MTSKKRLREQLIDAKERYMAAWDAGFATAARIYTAGSADQWAEHLARVADAAKAEGYREGYGQACEDAHATAALGAIHHQPEPEATPDPAEPADGQLNAFSADCGFFCHRLGPRPDVWQPGSVTRWQWMTTADDEGSVTR